MSATQALLKKIAESKASAGGNSIRQGRYLFEVRALLVERRFKGTMFIAELEVAEAEKVAADVDPNPVGSSASYVVNLDNNPSAPGNMKAFFLALLGLDEAATKQDDLVEKMGRYLDEKQMGRGMLIGDETYVKPTKAGTDFVAHKWIRVEQADADVAKRRSARAS